MEYGPHNHGSNPQQHDHAPHFEPWFPHGTNRPSRLIIRPPAPRTERRRRGKNRRALIALTAHHRHGLILAWQPWNGAIGICYHPMLSPMVRLRVRFGAGDSEHFRDTGFQPVGCGMPQPSAAGRFSNRAGERCEDTVTGISDCPGCCRIREIPPCVRAYMHHGQRCPCHENAPRKLSRTFLVRLPPLKPGP